MKGRYTEIERLNRVEPTCIKHRREIHLTDKRSNQGSYDQAKKDRDRTHEPFGKTIEQNNQQEDTKAQR
ncbi:hypothetical protein D3C87_853370 [compost metagenome]